MRTKRGKRHTPEQIVRKLRDADALLNAGKDQAAGKATLVAALGLDGARLRAKELAAEARQRAEALGAVKGDLAYDLVAHLLARRA